MADNEKNEKTAEELAQKILRAKEETFDIEKKILEQRIKISDLEGTSAVDLAKQLQIQRAEAIVQRELNSLAKEFGVENLSRLRLLSKENTELKQLLSLIDQRLDLEKISIERQSIHARQQKIINELTDKIGEGAKKIGNAYLEILKSTNRWKTVSSLLLKEGVDLFISYEKAAETFRRETGLTISQSKEQRALAEQINAEYQRFGVNLEDAYKSISAIQATFGGLRLETDETARTTALLAANFGVAAENTAQVLSKFQGLGGATQAVSINTIKSAAAISRAAGVPFAKVMEDVAKASDDVLVTVGATPQKLLAASIQARALGIDLNTAASAARRLLDFNTSINDELNASALLGRSVNFQRARQLAFDGDIVEANKEILHQVRMAGDFDKMNLFQKEALAKAAGMELSSLNKMMAVENIRQRGTEDQRNRLRALDDQLERMEKLTKETDEQILLEREMQSVMTNLNNTFKQIAVSVARFITPLIEGLAFVASGLNFVADGFAMLEQKLGILGPATSNTLRIATLATAIFVAAIIKSGIAMLATTIKAKILTSTLAKLTAASTAAAAANASATAASAAATRGLGGGIASIAVAIKPILIGVAAVLAISIGIAALGGSLIVLGKGFKSIGEGIKDIDALNLLKIGGAIALLTTSLAGMGLLAGAGVVGLGLLTGSLWLIGKTIKGIDVEMFEKIGTGISNIFNAFTNVPNASAGLDFMKSFSELSIKEDVINKLERLASLSNGLMQTAIAMERLSNAVSTLSEVNYDNINTGTINRMAATTPQPSTLSVDLNPVVTAINSLRNDLLEGKVAVYLDGVKLSKQVARVAA
jgi:hypothetical protein